MKRLSFSLGFLLLLLASFAFAQPYGIDLGTYSQDFSTTYYLTHNGTPVANGMLVQIIDPGANHNLDLPDVTAGNLGNVTSDDRIVGTIGIGDATGDPGSYYESPGITAIESGAVGLQLTTGQTFFLRNWLTVGRTDPFPFPGGSLYTDCGPYTVLTRADAGNGVFVTVDYAATPAWLQAGSGGAPNVEVHMSGSVVNSGATLPFGSSVIGVPAQNTLWVVNTGTASLTVGSFLATGDYGTTTATTPIAAGDSASFAITFTPTATGARPGTFSFTHNAAGSPYTLVLSGTGLPVAAPLVTVTVGGNPPADPVDFGSVAMPNFGDVTFHIQNTGTANLNLSSLAATGDYAVQGATSYSNITPATGVNVVVRFTPSTTGTLTGTFTFSHNAAGGSFSANLSGTGLPAAAPALDVSDGVNSYVSGGVVSFATTSVGSSSNIVLTITNTGTAPLTLSGFSATGVFMTTSPASPVAPGNNVLVTLTFTPTAPGPFSGNFQFTHNAAGANPFQLTLNGTANPYHNNVNNPNGPGTGFHATFPNDPNTNGLPPLILDFGTPGTNPGNLDCIVQDTRYLTMPNNIPGFGGDQPWDNNLTIHRYWDITATGGVGWTCTVFFYFTDNDLPAGIPNPLAVPLYAYAYNTVSHTWSYYVVHVTLFQAGSPNVYQGIVYSIGGFSEWEITQQQPTPVNALRFNAAAGDRSVALNWHVEAEVSNAYYRIERRNVTENTDWTVIHNVNSLAPNGTSSQPLNYRYQDTYNLINGETYEYRIADVSMDGIATNRATIQATPHAAVIADYALANFPNPFNPETRISYTMKVDGKVKITVTDVMGRTIATLVNGETRLAGTYSLTWNATSMPSGIYFLNMETNGFNAMRKMVLAK